ncbi:MAG: hypothetical protein MZV64_42405 [Ignavibacteriales bacterium]|nr:hypothetical protein [Ignavibacteriales bacterium]
MESLRHSPDAPRRPLPAWARAADALAVAVAGLALLVAGFGGFRLHLLGHRLSVTSGSRILMAALVILLVRHSVRRDHPLYLRAWRSIGRWWAADGVREVVPMWAGLEAGRAAGRVSRGGDLRLPGRRRALQAVRERVPGPAGPPRRGLVPRNRGRGLQVGPRERAATRTSRSCRRCLC